MSTAAWPLAQGADIVPIPGAKRRTYLEQNCAAVNVKLTKDEIESLSRAFPLNATAGTRYPRSSWPASGSRARNKTRKNQPQINADKRR